MKRNWALLGGLVVLSVLVAVALLAPVIAQQDPSYVPHGHSRLAPSSEHLFGTDVQGRDLFARVVFGARTSLITAVFVGLAAAVLGGLLGSISGYLQGWVDIAILRFTDVVLVFPNVLLASALVVAMGRSEPTVVVVLSLVAWPVVARVARASVIEAKQAGFVEAARAMGATHWQIFRRHILPHAWAPVSVVITLSSGTAVLAEATLSYLGVGVPDSVPSWGLMVDQGRRFLAGSPHIVLFPAFAVVVTVAAFFSVSEGLRMRAEDKS